ncbi:hypothetical protein GG344DRAFT_82428 [Lentinula edodes]|nr:hypothetical protein GG344DRAFT_82428 [Lentinula edodes]
MSTSRTQTTTTPASTAGPSGQRRQCPTPVRPAPFEDDDLDEDKEEVIRKAEEKVPRMKERKAAAAAAAKQKAEEEAAKRLAEEERVQALAREERRQRMAEAATTRMVEIRRVKGKGKGRVQDEAAGGDPDDGDDGEDDDDDDRAPCERCRVKKISCQMQAGKRSSIICKPCHDTKVKCSYSGRLSTVKREGGSNPTGERLAVLESQVAQLLADNRQLRDDHVKANTYHQHFNRKLDWLICHEEEENSTGVAGRGPSGVSKKRRRVVDSDEEEEMEKEKEEVEVEVEVVEIEEEGEEERDEPAPKKARSEKGKERAEE